jgi:hypothetical protein
MSLLALGVVLEKRCKYRLWQSKNYEEGYNVKIKGGNATNEMLTVSYICGLGKIRR